MSTTFDPDLEYFLGIGLAKAEANLLTKFRKQWENRQVLSSPPHITIKPPFSYHFETALIDQLTKWANRQQSFEIIFKKLGTFKHRRYATVFLAPEKAEPFRILEQDLSRSIRFLPNQANFTPHLTLANKIPFEKLETVKQGVRSLNLNLKLTVNAITLFEHQRFQPWQAEEEFKFGNL